jgi:hypothetical protein
MILRALRGFAVRLRVGGQMSWRLLARLVISVALSLWIVTGLVPVAQSEQSETTSSFILGAAHQAPLLSIEPFARFTGTGWVNSWPPADEGKTLVPALDRVPLRWLAKPVPREWTLWPTTGAPIKAAVTGIAREDGGCTAPLVLTMASTPALDIAFADDNGPPLIAVDTQQLVEGVRRVKSTDPESRSLTQVIEQAFRANEPRFLMAPATRSLVEAARQEIDFATLEIETASLSRAARELEPSLYYFEAQKQTTLKSGLLFGIKARGWLRRNGTTWSAVGLTGAPFDEEGLSSVTPLGIVRVTGRVFWVSLLTYYESMEFAIDEILPQGSRRLLRSGGGGC